MIAALVLGFGALGLKAEAQDSAPVWLPPALANRLLRMHSPVIGPRQAPVTIVEFFDPSCEACRAFYPGVKDLLKKYPQEVRLVLRYATFHAGSDQVVRLLEASKRQGKFEPVLEAVLAAQPQWADHSRPDIDKAYRAAERAGLDLKRALADAASPAIDAVLKQERQDLIALKIDSTPTFFVNGESLAAHGIKPLTDLVDRKVLEARKR